MNPYILHSLRKFEEFAYMMEWESFKAMMKAFSALRQMQENVEDEKAFYLEKKEDLVGLLRKKYHRDTSRELRQRLETTIIYHPSELITLQENEWQGCLAFVADLELIR